jgi:hypothetical protein
MNDARARALLTGIDAPRPLPPALDAELTASLTGRDAALASADAPRPLPDDLRLRLEASLVQATPRRMPRDLRRRILAAAAAILVLAGMLTVVVGRDADEGGKVATGTRSTPDPVTGTGTDAGAAASGSGASGATGGVATGSSATTLPFTESGGGSSAGSGGAPAAADASATAGVAATPIRVAVLGGQTGVAAGFDAYVQQVNAAGGVRGRPIEVVASGAPGAVVTVNVDVAPASADIAGVLFETAFVDEARLHGPVVSLASPIERQARLAVAHAIPDAASGTRAAIYVGTAEPWSSTVPNAIEAALDERGVQSIRVPSTAAAPTEIPADVAFLSLAPDEVRAWVGAATSAPAGGVWGVGSSWDDGLAPRAAELALTVLSPYAPIGGDEQAALEAALGDEALTAAAVHGWVTGKAVAELLVRTSGAAITEADLDRLTGWPPGWAPPFAVRTGTRARTPDAVVLAPGPGGFSAAGDFETG